VVALVNDPVPLPLLVSVATWIDLWGGHVDRPVGGGAEGNASFGLTATDYHSACSWNVAISRVFRSGAYEVQTNSRRSCCFS